MAGAKDVFLTINIDTSKLEEALRQVEGRIRLIGYAAADAAVTMGLYFRRAQADELRRRTEVIRLREGDHQWQVEQWRKWGLLDTQEQVLEAARGAMGHGNDGSLALAFLKAGPAR